MPSLDALPVMQSQFVVQTDIFGDASFTQFSGLNDVSDTTTYADGLAYERYYLVGLARLEPMTITIPHDPENHETLIMYKRNNPCDTFTTIITPVRCDPNEIAGPSLVLLDCKLTTVKAFTVNRNNAEMALVELGFVADDYRMD